jgi:hypothetical protein
MSVTCNPHLHTATFSAALSIRNSNSLTPSQALLTTSCLNCCFSISSATRLSSSSLQDEAVLLPFSLTSNTDDFLEYLNQLEPAAAAAAKQQFITSDGGDSSASSSSSKAFDFGSLITAVEPLLQQQQQQPSLLQQQQQDVLHVAGGTLSPAPALLSTISGSSSSSSPPHPHKQQQLQSNVRVILIYGRSQLPLPQLRSQQQQGLIMDCLYVHSKPQAGLNAAQEVYGALEELVDGLGVRAGHAPFIYEATGGRPMKLLGCMVSSNVVTFLSYLTFVDGLGVPAGHAPFIYEATGGRPMKLLGCMVSLNVVTFLLLLLHMLACCVRTGDAQWPRLHITVA